MKICYFTHDSNLTGANRSMLDLIVGMKNKGVETFVVLRKPGPIENELNTLGVKYKIIRYYNDLRKKSHCKTFLKSMINRVSLVVLCNIIKKIKIDIIHNNDLMSCIGMRVAKKMKIPYVSHMRDMVEEDHGREFINKQEVCNLLDEASLIIYISNFVKNKFTKWTNNPNDVVIFDGLQIRNYYVENNIVFERKEINICIIGTIKETKGQLEALKGYNELIRNGFSNISLYIVGNLSNGKEEYMESIKKCITENKLNKVYLMPFMSTEKLKELRAKSDICLICSKAEALGRVTAESMLAGCLTIGADCGATSEIIKNDYNGLLYEHGDYRHLADVIAKAINNAEKSKAIAKAGTEYALKTFDTFEYANRVYKLYSRIINDKT